MTDEEVFPTKETAGVNCNWCGDKMFAGFDPTDDIHLEALKVSLKQHYARKHPCGGYLLDEDGQFLTTENPYIAMPKEKP